MESESSGRFATLHLNMPWPPSVYHGLRAGRRVRRRQGLGRRRGCERQRAEAVEDVAASASERGSRSTRSRSWLLEPGGPSGWLRAPASGLRLQRLVEQPRQRLRLAREAGADPLPSEALVGGAIDAALGGEKEDAAVARADGDGVRLAVAAALSVQCFIRQDARFDT